MIGLEGDVALPPKYEKPQVDKTALEKAAADATEKAATDYTAKSWGSLVQAVEKAMDVLADDKATQDQVNVASENLVKALEALVLKEVFIETAINGLDEDLQRAYEQGHITNQGILHSLLAKTDLIQKHQVDKQKLVVGLNALGNQIEAQSGKKITQEYAEELLSRIVELKNEIAALN